MREATAILKAGQVGLLGLPTDEASSYEMGAAEGPDACRAALYSDATNLWTEAGVDLGASDRFVDLGNLTLGRGEAKRRQIEARVAAERAAGGRLVCLGGDHSVAHPLLRAHRDPRLTVVQIDAHPDLYEDYFGDRHSHACPFARVMEEGLIGRLIQVGIRTANTHQREQAARFGVEMLPRAAWDDIARLGLVAPVYLSLDLDALDPAYAPGVSHPEPGGLTTLEVLRWIWALPGLVGADVVELNPARDLSGITAAVAAKCVKEIAGRMLG